MATAEVAKAEAFKQEHETEEKQAMDRATDEQIEEMLGESDRDLAKAMPALEAAAAALNVLSKADLVEVKAMKKPPNGVKLVLEAVCLLLGVAPDKVKDPNGGRKKVDDFWGAAQRHVLGDPSLLEKLKAYDKDDIPPAMVERVASEYTAREAFDPDVIKNASLAAAGLCKWVHAMVTYATIKSEVEPKRARIEAIRAEREIRHQLAGAKPDMEAAAAAVDCISKSMLTELKSMAKPPAGVDLVTAACLVLVEREYKNHKWDRAKKMMANVDQFLAKLRAFRAEDISEADVKRVEVFVNNPAFTVEVMRSKSLAAANLCTWVLSICCFHRIYVKAKPLIASLEVAKRVEFEAKVSRRSVEANKAAAASAARPARAEPPLAPAEEAHRAARAMLARAVQKGAILELRQLPKPPALVHTIACAMCALLRGVPQAPQLDGGDNDSDAPWAALRKLMYDARLFPSLQSFADRFEEDRVPDSNFEVARARLARDGALAPESVRGVSRAAADVHAWLLAALELRDTARERRVAPARAVLAADRTADLRELKSLGKPPAGVDKVVDALGAMIGCELRASTVPQMARAMQTFAARAEGGGVPQDARALAHALACELSPKELEAKSKAAAGVYDWLRAAVTFTDAAAPPPPPAAGGSGGAALPPPPPSGGDDDSASVAGSWSEVASDASWSQVDAEERRADGFGDALAFEPLCEPQPTVAPPARWAGAPEVRALCSGGADGDAVEAAWRAAAASAPPPIARDVADALAHGEPLPLSEVRRHPQLRVIAVRLDASGELAPLGCFGATGLVVVHADAPEVAAFDAAVRARRAKAADAPSDADVHRLLEAALESTKVGHVAAAPVPPWTRDPDVATGQQAAAPPPAAAPPAAAAAPSPRRPPIDLAAPWASASPDDRFGDAATTAAPPPSPPAKKATSFVAPPPSPTGVADAAMIADVCVAFEPSACDATDIAAIRAAASRATRAQNGRTNDEVFALAAPELVDALCARKRADATALATEIASGNAAWRHNGEWIAGEAPFEEDRAAAARATEAAGEAFIASLRADAGDALEAGFDPAAPIPPAGLWTPLAPLGVAEDVGGAAQPPLPRAEQKLRLARVAARVARHLHSKEEERCERDTEAAFLRRRLLWFADAMRRAETALALAADGGGAAAVGEAPPPCPLAPAVAARLAKPDADAARTRARKARAYARRDAALAAIERRYAAHLTKGEDAAGSETARIAAALAAHRAAFDAAADASAAVDLARDIAPPPRSLALSPEDYATKLTDDAALAHGACYLPQDEPRPGAPDHRDRSQPLAFQPTFAKSGSGKSPRGVSRNVLGGFFVA